MLNVEKWEHNADLPKLLDDHTYKIIDNEFKHYYKYNDTDRIGIGEASWLFGITKEDIKTYIRMSDSCVWKKYNKTTQELIDDDDDVELAGKYKYLITKV